MSDPVDAFACKRVTCSHGCDFSLAEAPETCPHGVGLFGSWARTNARILAACDRVKRAAALVEAMPRIEPPEGQS